MPTLEGIMLSAGAIRFLKELGKSMIQSAAYDGLKGAPSFLEKLTADESQTLKKYIETYLIYQRRSIEAFEPVKSYCISDLMLNNLLSVLLTSGEERERAFLLIVEGLMMNSMEQEQAEAVAKNLTEIVKRHFIEQNEISQAVLANDATQRLQEYFDQKQKEMMEFIAGFIQPLPAPASPFQPRLTYHSPVNRENDCIAREKELSELSDMLRRGDSLLLVNGVGGIGKTTVAARLYSLLKKEHTYVGWVNYHGSLKESLIESFRYPMLTHNTPEAREAKFRELWDFLMDAKDVLLFVDNVEQSTAQDRNLRELAGFDGVQVVLTSRLTELKGYEPYTIEVLPLPAAIDLFYHYCPLLAGKREETEAMVKDMVERMGCHTLAVELLAKNYPGTGMERYYRQLNEKGLNSFRLEFSTQHNDNDATVAEHLHKLFPMSQRTEEERRVLRNFALMPTKTIPFEVQDWIEKEEEPAYIGNTLKKLVETGWLTQNADGYYMHAVVSTTIRLDAMPEDIGREFVSFLGEKCDEYITDGETYLTALPKIELADAVLNAVTFVDEACAEAWNVLFYLYGTWSVYQNADWFAEKKLPAFEAVLGRESPVLATTYNNLAMLYKAKGDLDKALCYYEKALPIIKKTIRRKSSSYRHHL